MTLSVVGSASNASLRGGINGFPFDADAGALHAMYVSLTDKTIGRFDVSNPAAPSFLAVSAPLGGTNTFRFGIMVGRYGYVPEATNRRLAIADMTSASGITVTTTATNFLLTNAWGICKTANGNLAVVVTNSLTVVSITTPTAPTVVATLTDATNLNIPHGIASFGNYVAVTASGTSRLTIVDVSTPGTPVVAGSVADTTALASAVSVTISDDETLAYVICQNSAGSRLTIVDISTPATPTVVSSTLNLFNLTAFSGMFVPDATGTALLVADGGGAVLRKINVANSAVPVVEESIAVPFPPNPPGSPDSIVIRGDYAYCARGTTLSIVGPVTTVGGWTVGSIEV